MVTTMYPSNSYVPPVQEYDENFKLTDDYIATLPDLQDGNIKGSHVYIPHVGIHNFNIPLKIKTRDGEPIVVKASITGTVSLDAEKKSINMSRIIRTFYEHAENVFSLKLLEDVLKDIRVKSGSFDAQMDIRFSYPIKQEALRTEGLAGWQFYEVGFKIDLADDINSVNNIICRKFIEFDFVYSSACPCSYELAEYARATRNVATVPHSQRSVARVQLLLNEDHPHIWIEEIQELCLAALHTETQVLVKRPDEQAFAELNGTYTKFVEDAARQLHQVFDPREDIEDFRIVCSHLESLHSHDAIAILTKFSEDGYYLPTLSVQELRSLVR